MEDILKKRVDGVLVGFLQALAISIYSAIVGAFLFYIPSILPKPGFLGTFLLLIVFVFSAAVTGSLVFGLPTYLAINKRIKEAVSLLGYTLFYFFLIIVLTLLAIFVVMR